MKNTFIKLFALVITLCSCKSIPTTIASSAMNTEEIQVSINLKEINDDKVLVTVKSPKIKTNEVIYRIPKTIPGTYSEDNYGQYIDDLKAYDVNGKLLNVKKTDLNSWAISKAKTLDKITYLVNDTFDTEVGEGYGKEDIFSPAGSNIEAGKNIFLNTHCFVGYFTNYMSTPYKLTVSHPVELWGASSMIDQDADDSSDLFVTSSYAKLVENPIMYSKKDFSSFKVDDLDVLIAVFSPNGKITSDSISPDMKRMIIAQKQFLGDIKTTNKYSVLLYLSTEEKDAKGYGALEHPTVTTVVFPEFLPKKELSKMMVDVVSHEFFHLLTPLSIHSKEIQNFEFNDSKMSKHLWMYEGVTEYFSNLFQINQGLIEEEEFYTRIAEKIKNASKMDDTMPFTKMSANVLKAPYKEQYLNVYEKGALIGMCLDIIIRENSNGTRGILDLMKKLSLEYGVAKAFNDDELFAKITEFTYPEVGEFLKTYIAGPTPIPYETYLAKVGVTKTIKKQPSNVFYKDQKLYIAIDPSTNLIYILPNIELNEFYTNLGLKKGDDLLEINGKTINMETIYDLFLESEKWKENDPISVKINRYGKEQIINGTVKLPYEEIEVLEATDATKSVLKEAWLKG